MKLEVIEKIAALMTAAFGLVAALAWNGAIQTIFKYYFGEQGTILSMLLYAVIVTIIAVIVTIYIGKATDRIKATDEKKKK